MESVESFLKSKQDYIVTLAQVFVGEHPCIEVTTSLSIDEPAIEIVFSFLPPKDTKRPVKYDEFMHPRLASLTAEELKTVRAFVDLLNDDRLARSFCIEKGLITYRFTLKSNH